METLKLSYEELVEEIEKLGLDVFSEKRILSTIENVFQKRSKESGIPSNAPIEKPLWFTPVVQQVSSTLWQDHKPGDNLRMAAVKYLQEEAQNAGEKLFIHDGIDLIKSVLPENK